MKRARANASFYESLSHTEEPSHESIDPIELRAKAIYQVLNDLLDESPIDSELIEEAQELMTEQIQLRDENLSSS